MVVLVSTNDGDQLKLGLGCSIFLSHSGADKDFVRFLNEALCRSGYGVFYDEQSLPKAEKVSMRNIRAELKDVKLAVLVLSNAFFTRTEHPMSELATVVTAGIQMLPVFYKLSVDQFKTKCRNQVWLPTWNRWKINKEIITDWENSLEALSATNGIEYCKEATNPLELRNKIVAKVCQILKPDVRWSAEGVQGMDHLCQVVSECFAKTSLQQPCTSYPLVDVSLSEQNVVGGMYGIPGIGKSTLCKALCDFFVEEFNGRVYYIELGDHTTKVDHVRKRLDSFHTWLTGGIDAPPQHLSDDQLWNMLKLHNQRFGSLPVFLAIDNVQIGSMVEAEKYLECGPFPTGSKIFLTAQSVDILEALLVGKDNAFYYWIQSFPHLSFDEAKKIFLHKLDSREHSAADLSHEQGCVVDECVNMCTLNKSRSDYYPMLLIVLASYMRQTRDPLHWPGKLEELRRDGIFAAPSTHTHSLETIFKRLYDSLTEVQQHMLLDLALYLPDDLADDLKQYSDVEDVKEYWLDHIYADCDVQRDLSKIAYSSLVEVRGMSMIHAGKCLHVHDLVRDFVKKEGTKSCPERVFKEHQRVKPSWGRPWVNRQLIERVGILGCQFEDPTLDLSCIEDLRVLHLIHNEGLKQVQLSEAAWSSLQSVIVRTSTPIEISIVKEHRANKKLRGKKNWAFHVDVQNCAIPSEAICLHKKNPNSGLTWSNVVSLQLRNVRMIGRQVGFSLESFPQLHTLELNDLPGLRINLEFDRCPHIREINLEELPTLEAISGLEKNNVVKHLYIERCNSLRSLVLLDKCADYDVRGCQALESIEVRQSQFENMEAGGCLSVSGGPPIDIIGLSQRKFIRSVLYNFDELPRKYQVKQPLMLQGFKCSPEMVEQMFESSEDCSEQQIRTATIEGFSLQDNGLSMVVMKDVQDTSRHILALAKTSASSLKKLKVWCSREEGACGCHTHLLRFDNFKMTLRNLTIGCVSVRDLSSLENCSLMERLNIYGCLSARKWPDFGKMTSLRELIILCPGSLAYWPSHPSLCKLSIRGTHQISPEELVEVVTSLDFKCSYVAFQMLIDDVYSSRKDKLRIAKALKENSEKIISGSGIFPKISGDKDELLSRLSRLLYGLWVEADCTLHECTPACAEMKGPLQDCLRGLLSSKTFISLLLRTPDAYVDMDLWEHDMQSGRTSTWGGVNASKYAYESLVLVCCASIQTFEVVLDEKEYGLVGGRVDSFFAEWVKYGRLPFLVQNGKYRVPGMPKTRYLEYEPLPGMPRNMCREYQHNLSAVRVADAVCRMNQLLLKRDSY